MAYVKRWVKPGVHVIATQRVCGTISPPTPSPAPSAAPPATAPPKADPAAARRQSLPSARVMRTAAREELAGAAAPAAAARSTPRRSAHCSSEGAVGLAATGRSRGAAGAAPAGAAPPRGGLCPVAWHGPRSHQMVAKHQKEQRDARHRDCHHLRMNQGRVQSGCGLKRGRRRWLAGAHHHRHREQQGIEQSGPELLHPCGGTPEGQVLLHYPIAAGLSPAKWWKFQGPKHRHRRAKHALLKRLSWQGMGRPASLV
jgi:hypothetical protein